MDERRDSNGFLTLHKTKSQDSVSSTGRRRGSSIGSSFGSSWFKKLSNKISNMESEVGIPQSRRGSASSIYSGSSSQDADNDLATPSPTGASVSRTQSFKEGFFRKSNNSQSTLPSLPPHPSPQLAQHQQIQQHTRSTPSPSTSATPSHSSDNVSIEGTAKQARSIEGPATLSDLKKRKISTRSVGFALSTFADNPPQRIPPVSPNEGNIEFLPSGEVVVRRRRGPSFGGDSSSYLERNHVEIVKMAQTKARQNAEKLHTSITSNPLSHLFSSGGKSSSVNNSTACLNEEEEPTNQLIAGRDVDGTSNAKSSLFRRERSGSTRSDTDDENWENKDISEAITTPPPDQIYIRCCHLREIMPIRNILRQLQGQLAPIPRVRIANTKPTLVEIQAFSDFLTVVPVSSLVLDNHILTDEMLRLIFVGIARSRDIARITFVNTAIGHLGWQYLCSFLANSRKSLLALNLACTDPTGIPQRIPVINRQDMDWRLLTEALVTMGTLEELDLGGTLIKFDDLKYLVENAFKRGRILGLANNKLNHEEVKFIAYWAKLPDTQLMGINLSGNNLGRDEDWGIVQNFLTNPRIFQLSLRNSKLSHIHAAEIFKAISPQQAEKSSLRALDLSCNPELFPHIVDRLVLVLPKFPYLSRLQLENCNLTNDTIISLCEALCNCNRLVYLSFAGNGQLTESAATALCVAVHLSRSICTVEADISESDGVLRQQLAQYCIQNLEKNAGNLARQSNPEDDEDNAEMLNFNDDLKAVAKIINTSSTNPMSAESAKAVMERMEEMRHQIKLRMHSLIVQRRSGPLSVKDRESLMRLFFYSSNLDRLKREAFGHEAQEPPSSEEVVKNVGEEDLRPSLTRQNSQASIISLKKLEREEGESHKAYAEKLMDLDDNTMLDAVGKLQIRDLEQIIN